jgi:DNA repair protein RecN (Recombination protein N)
MLQQLSVRNLAVVEEVRVRFAPGLNVVTGETGAGKSVLIGALSLALGERADRGVIRAGAAEAGVEAHFHLSAPGAVDALLAAAGLPTCEDGRLIVRRSVAAAGGGRCWINDAAATVQTLRRLGLLLADLHGPYEHQSLLSGDFQLELLDAFGRCGPEKGGDESYRAAYDAWKGLERERAALAAAGAADAAAESDRLRHVVEEIASARLSAADGDELVARHAEAANAAAILELGGAVAAMLDEGEGSVFDALAAVQQRLGELARLLPEAGEWQQEARSAALQVQELGRTISGRLQRVEADPGLLARLEERMALVQRLRRRHGPSLADVLATLGQAEERLRELQSRDERLAALDAGIARAAATARERAAALSRARRSAARRLAGAITRELRGLGFARASFDVALTPREPGPAGADAAEFLFAPNPGEPAGPLRAIASGGEVSRVMLAVKAVLAAHDRVPLLVFDEIDANIGGEVGRAVGRRLRAVAERRQVICITHLPQVAAYGQAHYAVAKRVEGARTRARIEAVADDARAAELARMLGGEDMTPVTLSHAREMLRACQEECRAR